jgi:leucyl aminopeptidase
MLETRFEKEDSLPLRGTLVVPVAEGDSLQGILADLNDRTDGRIARAVAQAEFRGREGQVLDIPALTEDLGRLLLVGAGSAGELRAHGLERLGGRMIAALRERKVTEATVSLSALGEVEEKHPAAWIASGMALRNYVFDRYKTRKDEENGEGGKFRLVERVTIGCDDPAAAEEAFAPLAARAEAVHFARDLVNEPGNVLYPETFAARLKELEALGLAVEVWDEGRLKELGFGALLGVARGSARPPRVVVMRHAGADEQEAPLVFVGKGVTFDSGGISIKPSQGMDEMKGDMGGAAAVAGIMRVLAARGARVNAVGIVGLVENMPDGNAQRPGDIVTAYDGQTIAVLNTDAEGRLVLADCLAWARKELRPALMIDLATLTGAILIALGKEYAGLFANDDDLAAALAESGERTGEKVWRMPLGKAYDKLIDHDIADMKNIGGRNAGSITAAQFLKRFVGDVPWAHIDVAGTAMAAEKSDINDSWGSGWGVRLLDDFVRGREKK